MLFLKDEMSSVEDGSVFWLLGELRASLLAGWLQSWGAASYWLRWYLCFLGYGIKQLLGLEIGEQLWTLGWGDKWVVAEVSLEQWVRVLGVSGSRVSCYEYCKWKCWWQHKYRQEKSLWQSQVLVCLNLGWPTVWLITWSDWNQQIMWKRGHYCCFEWQHRILFWLSLDTVNGRYVQFPYMTHILTIAFLTLIFLVCFAPRFNITKS